jgi:hypothetical protein
MEHNDDDFKCVLSIGIRCFTEIYLKELQLRKFSSPLGSVYLNSTKQIIYLLENGIEDDLLIHTENYAKFKPYNDKFGNRSIHKDISDQMKIDNSNTHLMFHKAVFAHHNLNDEKDKVHFDRCFKRLEIIQKDKIKTLFCLFYHVNYFGYEPISMSDISKLADYLSCKFNCHLLVIHFCKLANNSMKYKLIMKTEKLTLYYVNSDETVFLPQKEILQKIMNEMNVNNESLLDIKYFNEHSSTINEPNSGP